MKEQRLPMDDVGVCSTGAAGLWMRHADICARMGGGNLQSTFTRSAGADRWNIFLTKGLNPFAPQAPGRHGFMICPKWEPQITRQVEFRLFIRHKDRADWRFMGMYRKKVQRKLAISEWKLFPEEVCHLHRALLFDYLTVCILSTRLRALGLLSSAHPTS